MKEPSRAARYRGVALSTVLAGAVVAPLVLLGDGAISLSPIAGGGHGAEYFSSRTGDPVGQQEPNPLLRVEGLESGTTLTEAYQPGVHQQTARLRVTGTLAAPTPREATALTPKVGGEAPVRGAVSQPSVIPPTTTPPPPSARPRSNPPPTTTPPPPSARPTSNPPPTTTPSESSANILSDTGAVGDAG